MDNQESVWRDVDAFAEKQLLGQNGALDWVIKNNQEGGLPNYDVSPLQGQFLSILTRAIGAKRILEIGTLGGFSTIFLARGLRHDGLITTLELESRHAEIARSNLEGAGVSEMVDIRVGAAAETLDQMVAANEGPFDLVFIDADKQNNPTYLKAAIALSRPGTVIITDNVVRGGQVIDSAINDESVTGTRAFFERAGDSENLTTTMLQTVGRKGHDGFAMSIVTE